MPAAGENFLGILEAFLYQKHIPERILDVFSRKNAPAILKNFPPAAAFYKGKLLKFLFPHLFP